MCVPSFIFIFSVTHLVRDAHRLERKLVGGYRSQHVNVSAIVTNTIRLMGHGLPFDGSSQRVELAQKLFGYGRFNPSTSPGSKAAPSAGPTRRHVMKQPPSLIARPGRGYDAQGPVRYYLR